jgi:hypothetical protein
MSHFDKEQFMLRMNLLERRSDYFANRVAEIISWHGDASKKRGLFSITASKIKLLYYKIRSAL